MYVGSIGNGGVSVVLESVVEFLLLGWLIVSMIGGFLERIKYKILDFIMGMVFVEGGVFGGKFGRSLRVNN